MCQARVVLIIQLFLDRIINKSVAAHYVRHCEIKVIVAADIVRPNKEKQLMKI